MKMHRPCKSPTAAMWLIDRKSTRLNSSHVRISYAVFCLKKKSNNGCGGNDKRRKSGGMRWKVRRLLRHEEHHIVQFLFRVAINDVALHHRFGQLFYPAFA